MGQLLWSRAGFHSTEHHMLLDIFYLAVGSGFLIACWFFVKACDRL
jgi:hypothetical protein